MLFNSIEFSIFLPIVFTLYWLLSKKNIRIQNLLIIIASYIFYGWWDWRFLILIMISTIADYSIGLSLQNETRETNRKLLLGLSILVNIGLLGFFKYFNFFVENFKDAFSLFGVSIQGNSLNIILPVGISFYTFQTLSYTIDVYRKKIEPTRDLIAFSAFVCFFPQLVAGPIERASNLLPQFYTKRKFRYDSAVDGMRQILWGLFKKIVIADNSARIVNAIFNNYQESSGSTLVLGAVFFAFQIYGDFSGYSDIAIGTARLFGLKLRRNFAFPYFSRDIAEFWRRWHISLSSWFKDYVYIPLGGSKGNTWKKIRNVFIIFLVSGFWHGANWTFLFWGALNALYFLPLLINKRNRENIDVISKNQIFPSIKEFAQISLTFVLTLIAWIFFRAESVAMAFDYLGSILSKTLFSIPDFHGGKTTLLLIVVMTIIEWIQRDRQHAMEFLNNKPEIYVRWTVYIAIILSLFWFGGTQQEFIYFQF